MKVLLLCYTERSEKNQSGGESRDRHLSWRIAEVNLLLGRHQNRRVLSVHARPVCRTQADLKTEGQIVKLWNDLEPF